jgi:hypothetical protein
VSIGACLRVWKYIIHYNNENQFGIFSLFTLPQCVFQKLGAPVCSFKQHRCDLFGACNFIIKYGGAIGTWMHWFFIVHKRTGAYIP